MFYITGDTHGMHSDTKSITALKRTGILKSDDYIFICGDFGYVWDNPFLSKAQKKRGETYESLYGPNWYQMESRQEKFVLDWMSEYLPHVCFIDGNHENFDRLEKYPVEVWNGGKVQFIRPNVIHLMRGQTYCINGKEIFAFGGARSHDMEGRHEHESWWHQELPTHKEIEEGRKNYNSPDIILTHTLPASIEPYGNRDEINLFLDEIFQKGFGKWFCGHYHEDGAYKGIRLIYNDIVLV